MNNVTQIKDKLRYRSHCGACGGTLFEFLVNSHNLSKITVMDIKCGNCGEEETIFPDRPTLFRRIVNRLLTHS